MIVFLKNLVCDSPTIRPIYIPINVHRPTGRIAMGPMEVHETVLFAAHLVGSGSASILFEITASCARCGLCLSR